MQLRKLPYRVDSRQSSTDVSFSFQIVESTSSGAVVVSQNEPHVSDGSYLWPGPDKAVH